MHLICKVQEKFYTQRALINFLPECVRLHDKHRKTTGTHFPSHKTGRLKSPLLVLFLNFIINPGSRPSSREKMDPKVFPDWEV